MPIARLVCVTILSLTVFGSAGFDPADAQSRWSEGDPKLAGVKAMMSVPDILSITVSDDGSKAAFVVETADWGQNWYDNEIHVWDGQTVKPLTQTEMGAAWAPRWRPGHDGLAYLQYTNGAGTQLYYLDARGSGPVPLTSLDSGVIDFRWSPDGQSIALLLVDRPSPSQSTKNDALGDFEVVEEDTVVRHLWLLNAAALIGDGAERANPVAIRRHPHLRRITGGDEFTIGSFFNNGGFEFTRDGLEIVFDHSQNSNSASVDTQDISAVAIETGRVRSVVNRPGADFNPKISEDGTLIAFETSNGPYVYYGRDHIGTVSQAGGEPKLLTASFPESAELKGWKDGSVVFIASNGMFRSVYSVDPEILEHQRITPEEIYVTEGAIAADGGELMFGGETLSSGLEIFRQDKGEEKQLTNLSDPAFKDAPFPKARIIRSEASDGLISTGVLYVPDNDDKGGPKPLMTIIHGGPKQTARPTRVHDYVYPVAHWLSEGYAVYYPNYRGSAGFGDEYRASSVRDLGKGPADDILSGVNVLVESGVADPERLFAMGWSQGGYLAAFLATHTDRFKAVSVGAGISDWKTYYAQSDNPEFTSQYLKAFPWTDPEVFQETSAIAALDCARTPLLIQHGETDRRVPIANAHELYRGAREVGVDARMVIYKGIGHWISKPKERLAAALHNIEWFESSLASDGRSPQEPSAPPLRLDTISSC